MNFHLRLLFIFMTSLISSLSLSFQVKAADHLIQSLSEGACWYEDNEEFLKLSSFNDKVNMQLSKEELSLKLNELLAAEKFKKVKRHNQFPTLIHCSGMGHSFITKAIDEKTSDTSCVWFAIKEDEIMIRSIGGIEDEKSEFCDGYKWGEGLIGLTGDADINWIKEQDLFINYVESYVKVTSYLYKIKLKESFVGKEKTVLDDLKKLKGIKYSELNKFQHSVGEWAKLD